MRVPGQASNSRAVHWFTDRSATGKAAVGGVGEMRWRFGSFDLDFEGRQLLENRKPVHITEQPLRILALLLTHPGALVTRRQLQAELWPEGAGVDLETSLNTAVRRLRQALGDDKFESGFIATVPGQGYRFLPPVERLDLPAGGEASIRRRWPWWTAGAAVAGMAVLAWTALRPLPPPRVLRIHALTSAGGLDYLVEPASDGGHLYYLRRAGDHWDLMQTAGGGATAVRVSMPFPNTQLFDVSVDGREWLLGSFRERGEAADLWRQARPGGAPVRIGNIQATEAHWFPDGGNILYAADSALWEVGADGSGRRRLLALPGTPNWITFSPDGSRLRFTMNDPAGTPALWEWQLGSRAAPVPVAGSLPRCCGQWTRDGRYFLYSAFRDGTWNLWAAPQTHRWWPLRPRAAVQLTVGPHSIWGAFTARSDDHVVFYQRALEEEVDRLDPGTGKLSPLLPGRDAFQLNYSADRRQVAYTDTRDGSLWAAELAAGGDLANLRQLSAPDAQASFPRWSPDGRWIAFSRNPLGGKERSWVIAASGGAARDLAGAALPNADISTPDWSPTGDRLVVSVNQHQPQQPDRTWLALVPRSSGKLEAVPGSQGLQAARWSPDGGALAAFSADQHRLEVYDFARAAWQTVAGGRALSIPEWSHDGRYLYYQDLLAPGEPLYRLHRGDWRREPVAKFSAQLQGGVHRCGFYGLLPDGAPQISLNRAYANLRSADLDLP